VGRLTGGGFRTGTDSGGGSVSVVDGGVVGDMDWGACKSGGIEAGCSGFTLQPVKMKHAVSSITTMIYTKFGYFFMIVILYYILYKNTVDWNRPGIAIIIYYQNRLPFMI
jgi:hypothetical protein